MRTFSRRVRAETGLTPGAWLIQQRLTHARHLLETTDLPVDQVARSAGLGSAASLRQHLRATLGVAPLAYRRTFRASSTAPQPSARRHTAGGRSSNGVDSTTVVRVDTFAASRTWRNSSSSAAGDATRTRRMYDSSPATE